MVASLALELRQGAGFPNSLSTGCRSSSRKLKVVGVAYPLYQGSEALRWRASVGRQKYKTFLLRKALSRRKSGSISVLSRASAHPLEQAPEKKKADSCPLDLPTGSNVVLLILRQRVAHFLKVIAYGLLAAAFGLLFRIGPAQAAGRNSQTPVSKSAPQQPTKVEVDWGRSIPEENEDWDAEEREGLESDFLEHDVRDSQIDKAFEEAEISTSYSGTKENSPSEVIAHHWAGDLSAYDRQLKEIKAEAERTKKKKAQVISWPLRIAAVRESHPMEWVKAFGLTQGKHVNVARRVIANHEELLKKLAKEKASKKLGKGALLAHEIVSIGGAWLKPAIQQGLLSPLPLAQQSEWWERLGPKWRRFVTRNSEGDLDSQGQVYAVPYRFGQIVIAYREDMLDVMGGPIQDWQDLFRPELTGRIAMLGAPQEVVGIVLKTLGAAANVHNFDREVHGGRQAVLERYMQLRKQVRVFGDVQYSPALRNGDVLAAVGWAESFAPVMARVSSVKTVTPASGTLLWADFWAVPSGNELTPVSQQWLDYCLQPERAKGLGAEKLGLSPLILPPFPESTIPGLPLQAQLATTSSSDREGEPGTSDESARAKFNGLYAPRMAVSAQVSGVGKGPFQKGGVTSGQLPRLDILEKSELLEPLDEQGKVEYLWLLSSREEVESENIVEKLKRKVGALVGMSEQMRTRFGNLTGKLRAA